MKRAGLIKKFLKKAIHRIYRYICEDTQFLCELNEYKRWEIGSYTYGHPIGSPKVVYFGENAKLKIGKFCSFAGNVTITLGGYHPTNWVTTYPLNVFLFENPVHQEGHSVAKGDVVFGNDVWVATGTMILSGITIGNGAIIAASSVVTKDVPPYCIVAGNPAKIIRKRFSDDVIKKLEAIKWWDWPIEKIQAEVKNLQSDRIEDFLDKHFIVSD
ncbi:MAG: CatB-related O-acetyltransferase [Pseudanabaena sp. CAN_BIN31]|jgi:acetyltransferase-like isoleucine patch superfamily enzyme|nr:CatB-related O-acetyltransferase [Pseudanabaena sp. CAN_BIN31]